MLCIQYLQVVLVVATAQGDHYHDRKCGYALWAVVAALNSFCMRCGWLVSQSTLSNGEGASSRAQEGLGILLGVYFVTSTKGSVVCSEAAVKWFHALHVFRF